MDAVDGHPQRLCLGGVPCEWAEVFSRLKLTPPFVVWAIAVHRCPPHPGTLPSTHQFVDEIGADLRGTEPRRHRIEPGVRPHRGNTARANDATPAAATNRPRTMTLLLLSFSAW